MRRVPSLDAFITYSSPFWAWVYDRTCAGHVGCAGHALRRALVPAELLKPWAVVLLGES
jgi:hypothetical protein